MDTIDSLAVSFPHKARAALLALQRDTARWAEADRMRYTLLLTEAEARNGLPVSAHTAAVRRALAYYEHNGTEGELQYALLNLGNCLRDSNSLRGAMACYRELTQSDALVADTGAVVDALTSESRLLSLLLCSRQAIDLGRRAVDLAERTGRVRAAHLSALALAYLSAGDQVSARATLQQGLRRLQSEEGTALTLSAYVELLATCGDTATAHSYLQRLEAKPAAECPPPVLERARMSYYAHAGPADSAMLCARRCLTWSTTLGDSVAAYQTLVSLYAKTGNLAEGFALAATLGGLRLRELQGAGLFEAYQDEAMGLGLHAAADEKRVGSLTRHYRALLAGLGALLLLAAGVGWHMRRRWLRQNSRLQSTLSSQAGEVARLRRHVEIEQQSRARPQPTEADMDGVRARLEALKNGRGNPLTETEWQLIALWADGTRPDFRARMEEAGLYRNHDLRRMCYLVLMGYNRSDVWHILQTPRSTTYDRMARIQAALGPMPG